MDSGHNQLRNRNKYGLARYIPSPIRKEIRRRCGFGCAICGDAIITYEHIDPPFEEAQSHEPSCITLLCGTHQLQSTKGILSKQTIKENDRDPYCNRVGHANHIFDLGGNRPNLLIGGNDFTECGPIIEVDGETLFEIRPPEKNSSRWRLSAIFKDPYGATVCDIHNNELILSIAAFDIVNEANRFAIYSSDNILLELELVPPTSLLLKSYKIFTANGVLRIGESRVPDIQSSLDNPGAPNKFIMKPTITFEAADGTTGPTFDTCSFAFPTGLVIRFKDGGIQFGPH
jgi:hypothetical protein